MLTIRPATIDDIDVLYDLIIAIARYHDQEQYVYTTKQELADAGFGSSAKFGALLAEVDGKVAGYVSYTLDYSIWFGGSFMRLDDLFVLQPFRGQKIGEALMQELKTVCQKLGYQRISWEVEQDNHQAIKFYQRLGADIGVKGLCRWSV